MRLAARLIPTLVAILGTACSSGDHFTNVTAPPGLRLEVSPAIDTLFVADTVTGSDRVKLSISATSIGRPVATPAGVEFSSSDQSVAVVDATGIVSAVGFGTAQITAQVAGAKGTATIVVATKVTAVSFSPTTIVALVGDTVVVTGSAVDAKGALVPGTAYEFSLADPTSASITKTSTRTARVVILKPGTVSIGLYAGGVSANLLGTAQPREFLTAAASGAAPGSLILSAGEDATCGLLPLGRAFCFGHVPLIGVAKDTSCFDDIPGLPPSGCSLVALRVSGQVNLVAVSVGDSVACGVTPDSRAYCWGSQKYGQLGNGVASTAASTTPSLVIGAVTRTAVSLNRVSAGGNHVCGLNAQGAAFCWGQDSVFQLGAGGSAPNSATALSVAGGFTFSAISAGRTHTCALRVPDGVAMCWGDNSQGQLGAGSAGPPSDVPVTVNAAPTFVAIAAGGFHTCGLTSVGVVWCWGSNQFGQLGRGAGDPSVSGPAPVAGVFRSIAVGRYSSCGITANGTVSCWGRNNYGQLGNGSAAGFSSSPVAVTGGRNDFVGITVGARHACGLATSGVYCWGSNVFGALGNELPATSQPVPTRTATPK